MVFSNYIEMKDNNKISMSSHPVIFTLLTYELLSLTDKEKNYQLCNFREDIVSKSVSEEKGKKRPARF